MEADIKIECERTNVSNTIRIWSKRKGWLFRTSHEYEKSIIDIYHYNTKIASLFWYYEKFEGGLIKDEIIYFVIDKKMEQGYSMTDRRFIKSLLNDNYKTFKKWAGKIKRYGN